MEKILCYEISAEYLEVAGDKLIEIINKRLEDKKIKNVIVNTFTLTEDVGDLIIDYHFSNATEDILKKYIEEILLRFNISFDYSN